MADSTNPNPNKKTFKDLTQESPVENTPQEMPIQHQMDITNTTVGGLTRLQTQNVFSHKQDIKGLKKAIIAKVEKNPNLFIGHMDRYETEKKYKKNSTEITRYKVIIKGNVGDINSEVIFYNDLACWASQDYCLDSTVEPADATVGAICYIDPSSNMIMSVETNRDKDDISKYKSLPSDVYTAKSSFDVPAAQASSGMPDSTNPLYALWHTTSSTGFTPPAQRQELLPDNKDKTWGAPLNGRFFITSTAGLRKDPFTGERQIHGALDIGAPIGTPIYAVADGYVGFVHLIDKGSCGMYVQLNIKDNNRLFSINHCHMSEVKVKIGQKVNKGDIIGLVGSTGKSEGFHLHFQIRLNNGNLIDPFDVDKLKSILPAENKRQWHNWVADINRS